MLSVLYTLVEANGLLCSDSVQDQTIHKMSGNHVEQRLDVRIHKLFNYANTFFRIEIEEYLKAELAVFKKFLHVRKKAFRIGTVHDPVIVS